MMLNYHAFIIPCIKHNLSVASSYGLLEQNCVEKIAQHHKPTSPASLSLTVYVMRELLVCKRWKCWISQYDRMINICV